MITMSVQLHCRGPTGKVSRMRAGAAWVIALLMRKTGNTESFKCVYSIKRKHVAKAANSFPEPNEKPANGPVLNQYKYAVEACTRA